MVLGPEDEKKTGQGEAGDGVWGVGPDHTGLCQELFRMAEGSFSYVL